ncbi:hypothetical protein CROQUDRAFT_659083 [Cronartium quercuum f. sp. fusiforme G11]|uniref:Phosphoinositide phospholipase C n=1 Tax=Cronartium quercuum f. sp. fusiforme G11 TaxID=708437 RepID=A0A9P6NGF6_9BASI|nr:hypothetical protein CROQUDRAFT_659083 [Cronartium quercuum f. sp. fusiforme G11]
MSVLPTRSDSIQSYSSVSSMRDIQIPELLQMGTQMVKVSAKKTLKLTVSLNRERGQIIWESKKGGSLNIESIREIRFGRDASYYRAQFKINPEYETVWLTIIYISKKSTYKMLHLFALQPDVFEAWKITLERILSFRRELLGGLNHMRKRQAYWLEQHWNGANVINDPKLNLQETVDLCKRINISVPEASIRANFNMADPDKKGFLDFTGFQQFVKLIKTRNDLDKIFQRITSGKKTMGVEEFITFMKDVQQSHLPPTSLKAIYSKFLDEVEKDTEPLMTVEGFNSFLQSSDNAAFDESHLQVCQDMSHPICDYFISSSHNTYLVGNQLKGESTVEGYIRALQEGARSVELDCWDGDSGEPVIYHGRTLTRKLLVSEALKVISKYAFVVTPYPLILSLEVHCQASQQERLTELLKIYLGDALVDRKLDGIESGVIPSPQQLMYRILIKAKKTVVINELTPKPVELTPEAADPLVSSTTTTSNTSGSSTSSDSDLKRIFTKASTKLGHRFKRISKAISPSNETQIPPLDTFPNPKLSTAPLTSNLSSIIVYTVGVKARGFNKLTKYDPEHVLSLSERAVNKFLKSAPLDLLGHTRNHLTRAYPAAMRVFSGNFLPHRFWAVGLQLVALNWQTYDLGMELNHALFNLNGRSGYVLKPEILRMKKGFKEKKDFIIQLTKYELEIEIISAQQLPRIEDRLIEEDGPDVAVEVQVIGSNCNSHIHSNMRRRTKVIKGNGLNPIFDEKFKIPFEVQGGMLSLSFIRLLVCDTTRGDEDDAMLGRISICLEGLQPGYRHLPLLDSAGHPLMFASLFIKSQIRKLEN